MKPWITLNWNIFGVGLFLWFSPKWGVFYFGLFNFGGCQTFSLTILAVTIFGVFNFGTSREAPNTPILTIPQKFPNLQYYPSLRMFITSHNLKTMMDLPYKLRVISDRSIFFLSLLVLSPKDILLKYWFLWCTSFCYFHSEHKKDRNCTRKIDF